MQKAKNIKIVSVDLFRTLIDVDPPTESHWQQFMRMNLPADIARRYWHRADEILSRRWDEAGIDEKQFKSVRTILEDVGKELFAEADIDYDPRQAADIIMHYHTVENVFSDAKQFLNAVGAKYPVCLSTDADTTMLENINQFYAFDAIFVSEELRAYKLNPTFFQKVISHYNVLPENILHIGDSKSDIIVPKQLGIQTCWLDRYSRIWEHNVKPDF